MEEKNQPLDSEVLAQVHIVGPVKLQNELLRGFLERATGLKCMCYQESRLSIVDLKTAQSSLILWDCLNTDPVNLWNKVHMVLNFNRAQFPVALFNVSPEWGIYKEAVDRGVRGIFLANDPPHIFTKGAMAILNKGWWLPRDALPESLFGGRDLPSFTQETQVALTPREKEILLMIVLGRTNYKIADNLCISPHTVKAHIYSIYQKIRVSNRLHAALWASKNL